MRNINIKIKILIYFLVTFGFIYIWTRVINFSELRPVFKQINYFFIILAIILNLVQSIFSSVRINYLFKSDSITKLRLFDIWTGGWISSLVTSFLPFYSGGFVYALLLSKKANISYKKSFKILLTDVFLSIFNVFMILILPLIKVKNNKFFIKAIGVSLITFLIGIANTYMYFLGFGLVLPFWKFILAQIIFTFANLIPGVPLKIGQYELTGVLVFSYMFGINSETLLAIFAFNHVISLMLISVIGLFSAYATNYKFSNNN